MHGQLSTKADVFSFGVLVLELISGRKNSTFSPVADSQNILEWVSSRAAEPVFLLLRFLRN